MGACTRVLGVVFRARNGVTEYLLLKTVPERGGFWQPVSGCVEEGESMEAALRREIGEESGLRGLLSVIEGVHHFEFSDPGPVRMHVFGVEVASSEEVALDGREHSEFRWCGYQEAMDLLYWEENREALRRLNGILCHEKC